jgi:hypothetical protein
MPPPPPPTVPVHRAPWASPTWWGTQRCAGGCPAARRTAIRDAGPWAARYSEPLVWGLSPEPAPVSPPPTLQCPGRPALPQCPLDRVHTRVWVAPVPHRRPNRGHTHFPKNTWLWLTVVHDTNFTKGAHNTQRGALAIPTLPAGGCVGWGEGVGAAFPLPTAGWGARRAQTRTPAGTKGGSGPPARWAGQQGPD